MALVVLSVVEQRLDAVRAVMSGESVVEVAARYEVARSTLHRWVGRYLEGSVAGLADRSHRPLSCPHQVDALVEAAVAEVRRRHPRWGAKRIRMELLRRMPPTWPVGVEPPSDRTVNRILLRQGLAQPRPRKGLGPRSFGSSIRNQRRARPVHQFAVANAVLLGQRHLRTVHASFCAAAAVDETSFDKYCQATSTARTLACQPQ
jgi:transposase